MRRITDNRQERPDGRDNPRRAARFGFCGLPPLMPARAVTTATEQIPCSLATIAATRSRIGTAAGGFMAHRMRGLNAIRGRARGRCIEGGRNEALIYIVFGETLWLPPAPSSQLTI
jgi:hypothetical protein